MIIRRFYFTRSVHVNRHEGSVQVRGSRPQAQQTYLCEFIHAGVHPLKPRHLIACGTLHVHGPPLRRSRGCAGHENGWLSVAMSQLQVFDADGAHTSRPWESCGLACAHYSRSVVTYMASCLVLQLLHAADGSARERRIGRVGRHAVRLAVIGGELALHFFATTKVGAYYYVLSSLGMLTAATAVEAWGKRPRKAAGDGGEATAAVPAAPLLQ